MPATRHFKRLAGDKPAVQGKSTRARMPSSNSAKAFEDKIAAIGPATKLSNPRKARSRSSQSVRQVTPPGEDLESPNDEPENTPNDPAAATPTQNRITISEGNTPLISSPLARRSEKIAPIPEDFNPAEPQPYAHRVQVTIIPHIRGSKKDGVITNININAGWGDQYGDPFQEWVLQGEVIQSRVTGIQKVFALMRDNGVLADQLKDQEVRSMLVTALGAPLGPVNHLGKQAKLYLRQNKKEREAAQGMAALRNAGQSSSDGGGDGSSASASDAELRQWGDQDYSAHGTGGGDDDFFGVDD